MALCVLYSKHNNYWCFLSRRLEDQLEICCKFCSKMDDIYEKLKWVHLKILSRNWNLNRSSMCTSFLWKEMNATNQFAVKRTSIGRHARHQVAARRSCYVAVVQNATCSNVEGMKFEVISVFRKLLRSEPCCCFRWNWFLRHVVRRLSMSEANNLHVSKTYKPSIGGLTNSAVVFCTKLRTTCT